MMYELGNWIAAVVLPTPAGPYMNSLSRLVTASGFLARSAMVRLRCTTFPVRICLACHRTGNEWTHRLVRLMLGFVWAFVNRKMPQTRHNFRLPLVRRNPLPEQALILRCVVGQDRLTGIYSQADDRGMYGCRLGTPNADDDLPHRPFGKA